MLTQDAALAQAERIRAAAITSFALLDTHEKLRGVKDDDVSQLIGLKQIDPVKQRRLVVAGAGAAAADDAHESICCVDVALWRG